MMSRVSGLIFASALSFAALVVSNTVTATCSYSCQTMAADLGDAAAENFTVLAAQRLLPSP
eukprot:2607275-Rhodomonas_salina.1